MANEIYPRIIMGLDISTACIGVCVVKDDGTDTPPQILAITHKTPKIPKNIKGIEALCLRKNIFETEFLKKINEYVDETITDVVIEEPLLSSNNTNTVATLLRFNGMVADAVYNTLGVVPNFISSYDARMYSFPELVAIRKYNKKGEEYSVKHILDAIKKDNIVLFGSYPFDIDKKTVMMNMVNETYQNNEIEWIMDGKGNLRKENYDACDSLICALAYININHHGIEKPTIVSHVVDETTENISIKYTTKIWNRTFDKCINLTN